MPSILSPVDRLAFDRDGFVLVRSLFDSEETNLLRHAMEKDPAMRDHFYSRQDYGYWYHNGCLFPLMASVMVALDPCTKNNGCLQVMSGSQHLGRIDHGLLDGEQVGADLTRVEQASKHLDVVHAEMEPGDGLFFHCNTLHRSDQNRSQDRRWTMIFCYNAARNDPYRKHHHPRYTPLEKVADEEIKKAGLRFLSSSSEGSFLKKPTSPKELTRHVGANYHGDR